jgi:hypothetical protein
MLKRTLVLLAGAILLGAGIVTVAQGPPDDNGPVRTGYVVVTPSEGDSSGLIVFETYGQKKGNGTTQAAVEGTMLTTHAVMFVSTNGRLSRNMGFAIANPGSTDPAEVTIDLCGEDGLSVATEVVTVDPTMQIAGYVTEMFDNHPSVVTDFTGTLEIVSEVPIAVVGLRFRGENFSTLPVTYLDDPVEVPVLSEGVGGLGAMILAHFAAGGGWASEIVLSNVGDAPLTVRVDVFGTDGLPMEVSLNELVGSSFVDIEIPAHGVYRLAPREKNGDDPF